MKDILTVWIILESRINLYEIEQLRFFIKDVFNFLKAIGQYALVVCLQYMLDAIVPNVWQENRSCLSETTTARLFVSVYSVCFKQKYDFTFVFNLSRFLQPPPHEIEGFISWLHWLFKKIDLISAIENAGKTVQRICMLISVFPGLRPN